MSLILAAVLIQTNPAEAFEAMRRTLEEARSLWYESKGEMKNGDDASTLTTSLRARPDRARLDLGITRGETTRDVKLSWDAQGCHERDGAKDLVAEEVQVDWRKRLTCGAARTGVPGLSFVASAATFVKRFRNDLPDFASLTCSEFAGGAEETVAGRKAWKVSCRATLKDAGLDPFSMTVWIDREKNVPLKRTIEAKAHDRAVSITETITRCDINPNPEITDADVSFPPR